MRSCASDPQRHPGVAHARLWYKGLPQVGVIHSLGQLRDGQSEAPLTKLLRDSDVQVARAAALAMGELGTATCADALMKAPADTIGHEVIGQALVVCADRLLDCQRHAPLLAKVYESLCQPSAASGLRIAALRGLARCGNNEAIGTAMVDEDRHVQQLGMRVVARVARSGASRREDRRLVC